MEIINLDIQLARILKEEEDADSLEEFEQNCKIKWFQNNFVIFYKISVSQINILQINQKSETLFKNDNFILNQDCNIIKGMAVECTKDTIYLYAVYSLTIESNLKKCIFSFDKCLNHIRVIELEYGIEFFLITSFDFNLFTISVVNNITILTVYGQNLEILETKGQGNRDLPFYFPLNLITKIQVTDKHIILVVLEVDMDFYFNYVVIMDRFNGFSWRTNIRLESTMLTRSYLNRFLVAYDKKSTFIQLYDYNSNIITQFKNLILENGTVLMDICQNEILFYDQRKKNIYVLFKNI